MSGVQIPINPEATDELCAWARANDLDPDRISMNDGHLPEIWDGHIYVGYIVRDENGKDVFDPLHCTLVVQPMVVPLKQEMPAHLGRVIETSEQLHQHACAACNPELCSAASTGS